MKAIRAINYIVLIIPIILGLIGIQDEEFLIMAALSTMVTGAAQVIIALIMILGKHRNPLLFSYFAIVAVFFLIWGFIGNYEFYIFVIPVMLALYFTYIVYIQMKLEKQKPSIEIRGNE
ncbi:hypothetical protein FMM05_08345 [Flavobacterium zepuense]|uniref:Uncharacterized protein n=1 Tax=Flavobacterium zepuense TaxID=2593302 RepID=A0A552V4A3_9FLAO|nr:hypothetical protein [Flavobacterium zepuense]TRW25303.1 hypothetical protein FMM05_08345 [Flavobacterium zepuense]